LKADPMQRENAAFPIRICEGRPKRGKRQPELMEEKRRFRGEPRRRDVFAMPKRPGKSEKPMGEGNRGPSGRWRRNFPPNDRGENHHLFPLKFQVAGSGGRPRAKAIPPTSPFGNQSYKIRQLRESGRRIPP
jgi:hypothetical protein